MYRQIDPNQIYLEDFKMQFGGKLRANNRWVILSKHMPWDRIEEIYARNFSPDSGVIAISSRIAFGSIFAKEHEECLIESVERFKERFGFYPEAVIADQIYRNRANLAYCKERGIRLSGPRLGRPKKDSEQDRAIEYRDRCERNIIEGRNGMAKRRFGLGLIMSILLQTAMTEAALKILCMNARIRLFLRIFFSQLFRRIFSPLFVLLS